jgi:hypothetical protein
MPRLTLRAFGYALALSLLFGCLPALAATSQPVLYSIGAGTPRVLAQGAQKSWPIKISEDNALAAVFQGGMWLPTPSGGRIYAKYQRHIVHAKGIWTWVGTVETVHGAQQVVLTFGDGGVFGLIPQASGYPLRIVTSQGETRVVETSAAAMARSTQTLRLRSQRDYAIPPRIASRGGQNTLMMRAEADAAVRQAAASSGPVTIDVMVAYSQGFANMLGSRSLALTRIQNLVDITNQAYIASGVNQRIRLVYTTEVSYADNTSNQSALDDITGVDENGNAVSIPASLTNIASLRTQYGADLVVMMRRYDNSTQGDCGVGWLIGGDQTAIVPSESSAYGYSVVSDGKDGDYYCLDTTFAHELGHNMGDAHDRANATSPGAYSYSYGYVGNGTNGFSTIMAYGTDTQTPLAIFSNPNISTCQNTPCGVADSSLSSADNVHSMNNTAALIAAFEPTMVALPPTTTTPVRNDINGDKYSDLYWRNFASQRFAYWLIDGATIKQMAPSLPVANDYALVASGNFDGDTKNLVDLLWDNNSSIWLWQNTGGSFKSMLIGSHPAGWSIVGECDVDGDGKADLLWRNDVSGNFAYWLMNGAVVRAKSTSTPVSLTYKIVATGDFNKDGKCDIVWDNGLNMWEWQSNGSGFNQAFVSTHPSGWTVIGGADVDGDGKTDLLWRSSDKSRFAYWLMNGANATNKAASIPVHAGNRFVGVGDFNGDGRADMLWMTSTSVVEWIGNGQTFYSASLATIPSGWVPSEP